MTTKITPIISGNSQAILCKKYLRPFKEPVEVDKGTNYPLWYEQHLCKHCGKSHETVEELLTRCSFGSEEFYNLLASFDFTPGSPVWFNAGTNQGTMSACFKFDVDDTMIETDAGILPVGTKAALVLKWGGGVGFYLGNIRPKDTLIRTTHGKACGPTAVMEYYHAGAQLITQSGKRQAAQMAILPHNHPDIREFIHSKDVPNDCICRSCKHLSNCKYTHTKVLSTFNISVSCTDDFMTRATTDSNSDEAKLFTEMIDCAWRRGDPGIYFIDTAERDNPTPWLGKLTGTNPCGEVPLLDNEACNLGSINLSHMVIPNKFSIGPDEGPENLIDTKKLERTVRLGVRYLDTVIDNNEYPLPVITETVRKTRKIGLGVMGWADMLAKLHIHYDTEMAVNLAEYVMGRIQEWAHDESFKLGAKKGHYPAFDDPEALSYGPPERRNAIVTCIAPAGTISNLADCSSGIEPHFTLEGTRMMGDGTILKENVRTDTQGFIPHVAHEINSLWQLRHQAAFQKYTDLAVSKTVNLPNSATREEVRSIFINAWKLGCKGVTIYRDGSREVQVINASKPEDVKYQVYETDKKFGTRRHKMPKDAIARRHSFSVGGVEGYLHAGLFEDGSPGELFITGSNQGSTVSGLLASLSIVTSLALQHGVPLETLVSKLQHIRFEPSGMTDDPKIPTAPSIVAYIYRYLGNTFLNGHDVKPGDTGMLCPDCGAAAIAEEGCLKCSKGCGWSRCG